MNYLAFFIITMFAIQMIVPSDSVRIILIQLAAAFASIALAIWVLV